MTAANRSLWKAFLHAPAWILLVLAGLAFWVGGRALSDWKNGQKVIGDVGSHCIRDRGNGVRLGFELLRVGLTYRRRSEKPRDCSQTERAKVCASVVSR